MYVTGCVRNLFLGYIPIKPNESVADFLSLFTLYGAADSNNIVITKHKNDGTPYSITYSLLHPNDMTISDRDIVVVQSVSNYPRIETATVSGEVTRPGPYSINRRVTAAQDLITLAGGPTIYGNVKRAYIIRRAKVALIEKSLNPPISPTQSQTPSRPPTPISVRPEISTALLGMSNTGDYSIIPLRDANKNALLEPNDEIVVPKIENMVYVSGNVMAPGAYPFVEGKDACYYIRCAGGRTHKADISNIFIMTQYYEGYQIKGIKTVEEGDLVVVPESLQYKYFSSVLIPLLSIVLSAFSTILVLYSVVK